MNDEGKLRDFATRITRKQISTGDIDADAAPPSVRVTVSVGSSRRASVVVGKVGDADQRDPAEIVETVRAILAGQDGEEPRAYVAAFYVGDSNPFDSVILPLADEAAPAATTQRKTADDHLSTAMLVIERMARNADSRADAAEYRAQHAQDRVIGLVERAMLAEAETEQIGMIAEVEASRGDRRAEQIGALVNSPVGRAVAARLLAGAPRPKGITKAPVDSKGATPEPDGGRSDTPAPTPDEPVDARGEALAAIERLRAIRRDHPELVADEEIGAGIAAIVMGEPVEVEVEPEPEG